MLRNENLIPLSHQHQHALALCVRIERASPIPEPDLEAWRQEIEQLFQAEIHIHFAAEEQVLFPAAGRFEELNALIQDLLADHATLRETFGRRNTLSAQEIAALAQGLAAHIRKEERLLFQRVQHLMPPAELATVGKQLKVALKDIPQVCSVPTETTKLKRRAKQ
jgi:iron-sulfur cluster repair protein YtfE (RIC family)